MGDMLQTGLNWLEEQRRTHLSEPGIFKAFREDLGQLELDISITWGQTSYEIEAQTGIKIKSSNLDAIINFVDTGVDLEPQVGDVIEGQSDRKATVVDIGNGSWSWTDPYHNARRVHVEEDA